MFNIITSNILDVYDAFFGESENVQYYIYKSSAYGKKTPDNTDSLLVFDVLDDDFSYTNTCDTPNYSLPNGQISNDSVIRAEGYKVSLTYGKYTSDLRGTIIQQKVFDNIQSTLEQLQQGTQTLYIPYIASRGFFVNVHLNSFTPVKIDPSSANVMRWKLDFEYAQIASNIPIYTTVDPSQFRKPEYMP